MIWRPSVPRLVTWSDPCTECCGTGRVARPRESWEAPVYGDDTVTCPKCRGLGGSVRSTPLTDDLRKALEAAAGAPTTTNSSNDKE